MKWLYSHQVRQMFLDFFQEKGHAIEPSASLVPKNDPTLLWINSGVATLKPYFDGRIIPENPRIVNAQKSIRTNDIENVGVTARHHTFFEMLGNFSIGDYFKKEAIHWAWEFLTSEKWIGFDPDKLSVTIHPEDDEAFAIWNQEIGLPEERIIRLEENFWDIGEGPSGPNTEIFFDRGDDYGLLDENDPEMFPGGENERFLEIWNLVFSQFNHNPDHTYTPLPKKNIDTGMGLERMVSVIQEAKTNYDTDLFLPIIRYTETLTTNRYGESNEVDTAFKVIADHIRTVAFAVSDGALPSNEGRGYVLRRLLRRAVRFAKIIGLEEPFMYRLVNVVAENMAEFYPDVLKNNSFIQQVVKTEEERFHATLSEGLSILNEMLNELKAKGETTLSGANAFKLYDTYGFPVELTEEYASEAGLGVDLDEFLKEMNQQKDRARNAREDKGSMQIQGGVLGDITVNSSFVGYSDTSTTATVASLISQQKIVESASAGDEVVIILDQTPFYAESGGQVADTGYLHLANGSVFINDVQKAPNGQNAHYGVIEAGTVQLGDVVDAKVDRTTRSATVKNHTATHLLHQALKDVLGTHVNQAGSLVSPNRLRFDFSHFSAISADDLRVIEQKVNEQIWEATAVQIEEMDLAAAKEKGAMALFGEKYGDRVRVVSVDSYSVELCGGCHVGNTAEIGLFVIESESGIGAGTRRIEALTGKAAFERLQGEANKVQQIAGTLKASPSTVVDRATNLVNELRGLERENESLKGKLGARESGDVLSQVKTIEGVQVLAVQMSDVDMNGLRQRLDQLKQSLDSAVIVLGSASQDKVHIVAGVTKDLHPKGLRAGDIVKAVASMCGGSGGGRPDMAQAGGKEPEKLPAAIASVEDLVHDTLQKA
ncbi:alanine--tRNA ligase [Aureibacillus halotolerans]|uniref:Alanine--tRNA ligase n=1 Tax=Aureibacillus halotolerans TaxID=1508390 RepID=A0A4R6TW05_9BACI|nr:alanine--tRNA ligase [Aureibacillus halotolerans]TDQ38010.1 alanyl-tRNA synthetase [Aureibacillus halotolerans]